MNYEEEFTYHIEQLKEKYPDASPEQVSGLALTFLCIRVLEKLDQLIYLVTNIDTKVR